MLALVLLTTAQLAPGQGSRESDLEAIRARASELESQLSAIRERKKGLVGDLVEADYELQLQQQRLAEASEGLRDARLDLEAAEGSTAIVELRLAAARAAASRRITGLYRKGGRGALPLVLSVRFDGDLLSVLRSLRFLVRRDVELRRALNEARAEMTLQLRNLRFQRREVEILVDTEEARLEDGRRLRQRLASLLGEVERRERVAVREFGALADREGKLIDLLDRLSSVGGSTLEGREIQAYRGALDRPIVGSIVRGFGPRRDPRYKTMVPHNGLQFAGLRDEAVRAVFPGRVVFAGELEGYGPTVILLHQGRVFTLYAGLAGISVARDELVSIGQRIGRADSGLYFEVREENRPVDPAEWIR
jgi:septal ring factor EnvC (AmiA/AmiB activator)